MESLIEKLGKLSDTIRLGGSERAREKHVKRGKLLPRDR